MKAGAVIAEEVVGTGASIGWSGSIEELRAVENILEKFNVKYVDDMHGSWAWRAPKEAHAHATH